MNGVFKALSDPTRRRVLQLLREQPLSAGELADQFAVAKSTMSAHFAVLQGAGLIQAEKTGRTVLYRLKLSVLEDALLGFAQTFGWEMKPERTAARAAGGRPARPQGRRVMTDTHAIRSAVMFAGGSLISVSAVTLARKLGAIDDPTVGVRVMMATFGLLVAFYGNTIPKALAPLAADRGREVRAQGCRRRAGLTFVLAGVGYAAAWLALPMAIAPAASMIVLVGGIAGPLGWKALRRLAGA